MLQEHAARTRREQETENTEQEMEEDIGKDGQKILRLSTASLLHFFVLSLTQ